jgi:hypothetical protein
MKLTKLAKKIRKAIEKAKTNHVKNREVLHTSSKKVRQ